jgi:hypothetical protein
VANRFDRGATRVGFLYDGLPDTPLVSAMLRHEEKRIRLTMPYQSDSTRQYDRWFTGDSAHWVDDPDRSKYRYEPPTEFDFHHAYGPIALVGCRNAGMTGLGVSEGRIDVDFAVVGGRNAASFTTLNGLRSEIEGLGTWMGLRSLGQSAKYDDDSRLQSIDLHLDSPEPIRVVRMLNATIRPAFQYGPGPRADQTTITERMYVHTEARAARDWSSHLDIHFGIRDLLRVASWRPLNFLTHEALSDREPIRTLDGKSHGPQWLSVETFQTGKISESSATLSAHDYLFTFRDIGPTGVGRWMRARQDLSQGIAPILALHNMSGATVEAVLAQCGIALEALGHDLLVEGGDSKRSAASASFETRLRAVLDAVHNDLPFDAATFTDDMRVAYRGVKHGDRATPEAIQAYVCVRKSIQLFRAWAATRVGLRRKTLTERLAHDRVSQHIAQLDRRSKDEAQ